MDWEQFLDVGDGFARICGILGEGVQDRSAFIVEGTAQLLDFFLGAHQLELSRHDLEGRNRLHVVTHVEVTALGLVSFLGLQGVEGGRV